VATSIDDTPSVLLVDDRPENLLALAAVLEPLQVRLRTAGSGEQALKALLEEDFAVVLLDVQMPGMDGFETAKFIRGRERSRTTPIIFLTAVSTDIAQVARGYEAGAVDYVLKPFEPNMLRSKVSVFCDLERQRRARARADEMLLLAWRSLPTGAALVDADGRLLRSNPVLRKLTEGRAVNGVAVSTLVKLDDRLALDALLTAALAGATVPPAAELQLAGDEDLPVSILAWGVREHDGEILSVLIQVDDLRERRRAEAARERLAEERAGRARAEAAYERERTIASTLQRDLLPRRLPDAPGVALSAHFSAGGEGTAVGGDWFDAFTLPGGRLGLVIGDVAGRGVAAAARMGQLRSVARAYAVEGHTPAGVVARLNLYHQALRADDMTTLIYAVIEPDHGRLRLVNAGHPPPALVVPGASARLLEGSCPALGIAEICQAPEIVVDFPPGATLALFTDGLVERRHEGIDAGLARLLSALAGAPGDVDAVRDDVIEACLGPERVDDDVTALFVRAEASLGETIRLTLTPDPDALAAMRRMLRRWLIEMGAAPDEMGSIVMAANEAWQNAIEHGHDFQPVPVNVRFQREDDEVVVTVRDAGGRGQPAGDPDRGRGIALMRGLMDDTKLDLGSHRGGVAVLRRRIGVLAPVEPTAQRGGAAAEL
jgi:serine phosphatase RsbU (regulator of sigma subunit)/FixJ family two-component response regulator/anti-sigma regulatory factor (Ser/Thr protein kinase)